MGSRQRLFWHWDPYDLKGSEEKFLRACRDNCAWHIRRCPPYRDIMEHFGFEPHQLRTMEDLKKIPMLPTLFFKRHAVFSMPTWRMPMKVTSFNEIGDAFLTV